MKKPKQPPRPITVAFCSGDMLHADFCYSLSQLCMHEVQRGMHIGVANIKTTLIDVGRIRAAVEALKHNSSHLLCLDSDMRFPPDALKRLLHWNKPVVGCTYSQRRSPRALTHESMDHTTNLDGSILQEVRSLGFGCILIRTDVLRAIPRPWFHVELSTELDETGVEKHRSEDRLFCDKARAAGFDVFCDVGLSRELEHVGMFGFTMQHVEVWTIDNWGK
jgi:hypothetical protein